MKKLDFRLQRVLDYRRMVEKWAKDAYLSMRAARVAHEVVLANHIGRRSLILRRSAKTIQDRLDIEMQLMVLAEQETELLIELQVLEADEAGALSEWNAKRIEREVLEKLYDKALDDWTLKGNREEQRNLDEWATMRRTA